jgi:hypothetical protein
MVTVLLFKWDGRSKVSHWPRQVFEFTLDVFNAEAASSGGAFG